jgi:hypothetical protein
MALSVLYHIETMYPKVWAAMSGSCRRSLKNTIKSTFQIHAADIAASTAPSLRKESGIVSKETEVRALWAPERLDQIDTYALSAMLKLQNRIDALEKALNTAPDFGGEPKTAFGRGYRAWQESARSALHPSDNEVKK